MTVLFNQKDFFTPQENHTIKDEDRSPPNDIDVDVDTDVIRFFKTSLRCPYTLLGVPVFCQDFQFIKSAYRRKAFLSHPDTTPSITLPHSSSPSSSSSSNCFATINAAYRLLSHPTLKAQYDAWRHPWSQSHVQVSFPHMGEDTSSSSSSSWEYPCRCGQLIQVSHHFLALGFNVFECEGCSTCIEVIFHQDQEPLH
ncbi:hypothetical protein HMI54_004755 [Coelomomyces lativittatus]|nr:hypothetical protein HMI55_002756 [Coelomomyces lativittatus]KAJ1506842.1 hypothetical protein HMI54_004755 [Coelomomyces lativittatus]KAJ1507250.1 hypothetical protein HMI56_000193 [Coelomomyces lativittatus]